MDKVSTPTAPAATGTPHESWCSDHDHGGDHPEDGFCRRLATSPAFGRVALEQDLDGAPMIFGYGLRVEELTPAQARELGAVLIALADAADAASVPSPRTSA